MDNATDSSGDRPTTDANPVVTDAVTVSDLIAEVVGEENADNLEMVTANLPPLAAYNLLISFDENAEARQNIATLEKVGVEGSHISYLALDTSAANDSEGMMDDEQRDNADGSVARQVGKGAATGAATGAGAGALVGLGITLIPGVGVLAGVGLLGVAIGGAAAGGNLGLVWGGFRKLGVSAAWEKSFVDIEAGKTVVGVHTDDRAEFDRAVKHLPSDRLLFFDHAGHPVDWAEA